MTTPTRSVTGGQALTIDPYDKSTLGDIEVGGGWWVVGGGWWVVGCGWKVGWIRLRLARFAASRPRGPGMLTSSLDLAARADGV